ncbi:MAG: general negative regulator of transcription subunit 5 [Bogoriella megaspora]|nr:MAG: general negative regulator of transcription subunit 5 [Bogoriella megaspora]
MAQRKLQQEIDKVFKRVAEGVATFEGIYDKLQQSSNTSQKEKLEDSLKKEIKKLQRSRDQIKSWATSNEIKDKKPLVDQRKLIETQMEKFKAVEKEMKTKAFSKEGLAAQAKLDPKEREKLEMAEYLRNMVEELERQLESHEAELESVQSTAKKGKKDTAKADRISELERTAERHRWHIGKLELLLRSLENGNVETEQVKEAQDGISYYVENNQEVDFMEDDTIYDDFNLEEDDDAYGAAGDIDKVSSQDAQSIQDDEKETEIRHPDPKKSKQPATSETSTAAARRPSTQLRSPLPQLATLHSAAPTTTTGPPKDSMKPAPIPARAPGEGLKYASAAAAAAASDKNGIGIAPLPPPPTAQPATTPGLQQPSRRLSSAASPPAVPSQPVSVTQTPAQRPAVPAAVDSSSSAHAPARSPAPSHASAAAASAVVSSGPPTPPQDKADNISKSIQADETANASNSRKPSGTTAVKSSNDSSTPITNGDTVQQQPQEAEEEEPIYHLPASLQDLVAALESTKSIASAVDPTQPIDENNLANSYSQLPDTIDAEHPRHYRPAQPYFFSPAHYPQEPINVFDDSRIYNRIDTDTLFYAFYYRQGTYEQYLAAKALKGASWRFHKMYQTWFQRHEEPKTITEEFEQGTYRFFDYESTWMNRRKADFKFAYKFLEDDL